MRSAHLPLLLLALLPLRLQAQTPQPVLRGRGEPALDARIRELLREPGRTTWTADTTIARSDTMRGPLLIVGATVRLEGVLLGDVVAIGADLFIRPSARVLGRVQNLAGGWYASDQATMSGELDNRPNAPYSIEREDGAVIIRGTRNPRVLALEPLIPTHDRVDGLSAGGGVRLLLPPLERLEPTLGAWGSYRTERGQLDGGTSVTLARGGTSLGAGAERSTITNEAWIRGNLSNSVTSLFLGKDYRDYYEAERIWVELRRALERGERDTDLWLRGQVEDARSLPAEEPWSLFRPDSVRPNRAVDDGRVSSLLGGASVSWRRPTFETQLEGSAELALDALHGDFEFAAYRLDLDWAMLALRDHTLEIEAHLQGPLPFFDEGCTTCTGLPRRIPRQRWSQVGGSGTLYTFRTAAFQGDRVVFIESRYGIPLGPRFRLPFLGIPTLELLHATGMAWIPTQPRSFEQNLGLRLRYNVFYLRLVANPEDLTGDYELKAGITFPKRAYGWQPAGGFF